jgi:hypothetical protein
VNTQEQRILLDRIAEEAKGRERNKMIPFKGIVIEHGAGAYDGMVRVRRTPHEPPGSPERPFYFVFGEVPAIDAEVFVMANFATGVVKGEMPTPEAGGYDTPQEVLDAIKTVDGTGSALDSDTVDGSHASAFAASSHVGAGGAAHAAATTSVNGFQSASDKTKIDSLSNQARGAFTIRRSATQNNIPNTTETKINFDSEIVDVSGWYDTTAFRYTPQLAGYYQFAAAARILPGVAGKYVRLYLRKNGTSVYLLGQGTGQGTFEIDVSGNSPPIIANGSTDFFEVVLWHDLGVATSDIQAGIETYFGGRYLGTA